MNKNLIEAHTFDYKAKFLKKMYNHKPQQVSYWEKKV